MRREHRIGEHRDQEIDPRTFLGDLEKAGLRRDEHALHLRSDAREMEQDDADMRGEGLEQRHQFFTERHEQQRIAERERSEEHTYELQSLMRISYAVFCLKNKKYN